MTGFLGELGKKLAERWLSLLVLPGVLYLTVAAIAGTLGHLHAVDLARLAGSVTTYAQRPAAVGGQAVLLCAILAAAAMVGVLSQAIGAGLERLVLSVGWVGWPWPFSAFARRRVASRQRRWRAAHAHWEQAHLRARLPAASQRPAPRERHRAALKLAAVAVEPPARPTWTGDRVNAVAVRLQRDHHLDLATVWPALWLALPDPVRQEVLDARAALSRGSILAAWSLLYAPLAVWWWPAAVIAAVSALTARHRIRAAADTYAQLLEAAARLHTPALAATLRLVPDDGAPLDEALGHTLTQHLRTRRGTYE